MATYYLSFTRGDDIVVTLNSGGLTSNVHIPYYNWSNQAFPTNEQFWAGSPIYVWDLDDGTTISYCNGHLIIRNGYSNVNTFIVGPNERPFVDDLVNVIRHQLIMGMEAT